MLEKGYNIKMSLEASRFDELQKNKEKVLYYIIRKFHNITKIL